MLEKLPLGTWVKPWLESKAWYQRFKYSEAGLRMWLMYAARQRRVLQQEAVFFSNLLKPLASKEAPIFDIGANVGWVSRVLLDFSGKVVAVEPDAFNVQVLKRRLGHRNNLQVVEMAVSSRSGTMEFHVHEADSALNTLSPKWREALETGYLSCPRRFSPDLVPVSTTTLDELIGQHGLPALVKVDVEGHEREVFLGLSHALPLIIFEANLPVFLEETRDAVDRLSALDSRAVFSFAHGFKYQMEGFAGPQELMRRLEAAGRQSVDIICRMSNYPEFFKEA